MSGRQKSIGQEAATQIIDLLWTPFDERKRPYNESTIAAIIDKIVRERGEQAEPWKIVETKDCGLDKTLTVYQLHSATEFLAEATSFEPYNVKDLKRICDAHNATLSKPAKTKCWCGGKTKDMNEPKKVMSDWIEKAAVGILRLMDVDERDICDETPDVSAIIRRHYEQSGPWVKTSDRAPTEKDATPGGFVIVSSEMTGLIRDVHFTEALPNNSWTHWMPIPALPKEDKK